MADLNENLKLTLMEARLPGRIISMQSTIGDTLADLCGMTAYDLGRLKGVGDNVVDGTREILSFYGLTLSGDTRTDYYTGSEHPEVASYRDRLNEKHPGLVELLGTLSDREVGEQFDVSAQAINNHRRKLGIAKAKRAKKVKPYVARIESLESTINEALRLLLTPGVDPLSEVYDLLAAAVATEASEEASEEAEAPAEEVEVPAEEAPVAAQRVIPIIPPSDYPAPPAPPAGFEGALPPADPVPTPTTEDFNFGEDDFSDASVETGADSNEQTNPFNFG